MLKIAKVVFSESFGAWGSKRYDFHTDLTLKEGDIVVVDTVHGPGLAKVVVADSYTQLKGNLKWIIQKVDMVEFHKRKEMQENLEYLQKQQQVLIDQLESRWKQKDVISKYEQMASTDPEVADLLNRLKEIGELLK